MCSVDGIWWDSSKRIPDWTLVLRRNSDIGTRISPWVEFDVHDELVERALDATEQESFVMKRFASILLLLAVTLASAAGAEPPTADALLDELDFDADEKKRVLAGELVTSERPGTMEASDRELAVGMAFLLRRPPATVVSHFLEQRDYSVDPDLTAFGEIRGDGSLEAFAKLALRPNGAAMTQAYLEAAPGTDLNLHRSEIDAFRALASSGGASQAGVERELRRQLHARFLAYKQKGLAGIAPYERKGGPFQPADDLRKSVENAPVVKKYAPALVRTLLEYPGYEAPGLREDFLWTNFDIDDKPTFALNHRMVVEVGGGVYAVAERHYYVSRSHNAVQVLGALVPVQEGTVIFYVNRTSTDQAAGFGSAARHKIGRKVMGSQIGAIFEKVQQMP
jgi:hypothetical protein